LIVFNLKIREIKQLQLEKLEDIKGVIRNRNSKKDKQYNSQKRTERKKMADKTLAEN
jgi:hypothetical protein